MKKHCHNKAPWLSKVVLEAGVTHRNRCSTLPSIAPMPHQREDSATAWRLKAICANCGEEADDVEQAAEAENAVSGRRRRGEQVSKRTAGGGHRECEVRAALMAARGVCADQGAAGGAELGASLLSAAEKAAHSVDFTNPMFTNPIQSMVKARCKCDTLPCAIVSAFL